MCSAAPGSGEVADRCRRNNFFKRPHFVSNY
jgi:hypothetical protein